MVLQTKSFCCFVVIIISFLFWFLLDLKFHLKRLLPLFPLPFLFFRHYPTMTSCLFEGSSATYKSSVGNYFLLFFLPLPVFIKNFFTADLTLDHDVTISEFVFSRFAQYDNQGHGAFVEGPTGRTVPYQVMCLLLSIRKSSNASIARWFIHWHENVRMD